MALNPEAVGTVGDPYKVSWTSKDSLLYAVSLNVGTDQLQYVTENTNGVAQVALPTMPVVIGYGQGGGNSNPMRNVGEFNFAKLVHGSQAITLHKPIPAVGSATVTSRLVAMYDKVKAAVVFTEGQAIDDADGTPLYSTRSSVFIRDAGGWGGERGPSGAVNEPPSRAPDHEVTFKTSPDQALLYRLNGDRNPLHSDPSFAAIGGFDRPILHGLCTYGFTGRALLQTFCGGDASRFSHIEGRFASPVLPGDALTIRMWETGKGEAVFTTSVGDRVVIDQGLHRFS
jgi:acyl dehydratase